MWWLQKSILNLLLWGFEIRCLLFVCSARCEVNPLAVAVVSLFVCVWIAFHTAWGAVFSPCHTVYASSGTCCTLKPTFLAVEAPLLWRQLVLFILLTSVISVPFDQSFATISIAPVCCTETPSYKGLVGDLVSLITKICLGCSGLALDVACYFIAGNNLFGRYPLES